MSEIVWPSSTGVLKEEKEICRFDPEKLAYWYFRLNGFLTIENFVVHPDSGSAQRTEIDIIAARFPYRVELPSNENPMQDDKRLMLKPDKIRIILAEVKKGMCKLNPALKNPDKENLQQIISSVGPFEREKIDVVSCKLYKRGYYEDENFLLSLCCLGQNANHDISNQLPKVPQLTWDNVLSFIYKRFNRYEIYKRQHQQWDSTGQNLYKHFQKCDCIEFLETIEIAQ